jgi:chemotaxis signal transduction protein
MQQEPVAISPSFDYPPARHLAQLSDREFWQLACEQATRTGKSGCHEEYIECTLDSSGHRCWLPLETLSQAVPPPHRLALLPAMPPWMAGLVAWRGETLAAIDLASYLANSAEPVSYSAQLAQGMLVILSDTGRESHFSPSLALIVPALGAAVAIAPEQVQVSNLQEGGDIALASGWLAATRAAVIRGSYNDAPVLDVPALLADIVEQTGIAALDG